MRRAHLIVLCLAAASALAVAACGGDTDEKNDYVAAVDDQTEKLSPALSEATTEYAKANSPEQVSKVFSDLAAELDGVATDLRGIDPPDEVAGLQDRLIGRVGDLSAAAANAGDEVKAGGPATIAGVANEFNSESAMISGEVDSTLSEINSALQE